MVDTASMGLTSFRRITIAKTPAGWRRDTQPASLASRVGFEPTTKGLKVPCSATELPARPAPYHVPIGRSALPGDQPARLAKQAPAWPPSPSPTRILTGMAASGHLTDLI